MPWQRYLEVGVVDGNGSRTIALEPEPESEPSGGREGFPQVQEASAAREFLVWDEPAPEGAWMDQVAGPGVMREACAEVAEEVSDVVYHGGVSRPVRRVEWDVCEGRPVACDVEQSLWGPGEGGVPYPNVFLQTNLQGENCIPVNRLVSGRGLAPWIAHFRVSGVLDSGFAQSNEVLMFADYYANAQVAAALEMRAVGYFSDFETSIPSSRTSYLRGNVLLPSVNGLTWNFNECLLGNLANDYKEGSRSLRLRGYASTVFEMIEDKPNGIGEISFFYRRFNQPGEAQIEYIVEYSMNGGSTWAEAGRFQASESLTRQKFTASVNQSGNGRVRIIANTALVDATRRTNVDNLFIESYP